MNATITWNDSEKSILIAKVTRDWRLEDLKPTALAIREHINSVNHAVNLIIDVRDLHFRQTNMLSYFIDLDKHRLNNRRHAIVIGLNPYLQTLLRTAEIFAPKSLSNLYFVDDYASAERVLQKKLSEPVTT